MTTDLHKEVREAGARYAERNIAFLRGDCRDDLDMLRRAFRAGAQWMQLELAQTPPEPGAESEVCDHKWMSRWDDKGNMLSAWCDLCREPYSPNPPREG